MNVAIMNNNGNNVVSSRTVAEQLGKRHADVISKIKEVLDEREFSLVEYKDSKGEFRPELLLNKDGFILLCMNYTGYNDFKRAYIAEFNRMEKIANTPKPQKRLEDKTPHEILADNGLAMKSFFETIGLNIPKEIIAHTAVVGTTNQTGYEFNEVKLLLNKVDEEAYHTKSEICKKVGIKANKVNLSLIEMGIQIEGSTTMHPYILTEIGKEYAVERSYTNGKHQGYEIKLKANAEEYIRQNLSLIPASWIK
ncbi:MAG: Rha family transcriptional regulator [Fusobacteriaceae bacterium]